MSSTTASGLRASGGGGLSRYQQQLKGRKGQSFVRVQGQLERATQRPHNNDKTQRIEGDLIDSKFGFERYTEGPPRLGWLLNYLPTTMPDETGMEKSALDLYFIDREGGNFKTTIFYEPYFYIDVAEGSRSQAEVAQHLLKRFEGCRVDAVVLDDLDLPNHLGGRKHSLLKISFGTVAELMDVRSALRPIIAANKKRVAQEDTALSGWLSIYGDGATVANRDAMDLDPLAWVVDLREFDVPYTMRVAIDMDLRVGAWYIVKLTQSVVGCSVEWQKDMLELCEPRVLAFDIECEKAPLKFPNADHDRIFMISYMLKGQGFLIINREVVSEDIMDFEYTPQPRYPGPFHIFNERSEEGVLRKFLSHVQELRPHVIVTYNGDFFDWPYVETRCMKHGLSLYKELGIRAMRGASPASGLESMGAVHSGASGNSSSSDAQAGASTAAAMEGEYIGRSMVHLDAFCWVQRDSYLPQGNQGLKAVTKSKLGYDPVEVDAEDMVRLARENPHRMASYSVSDAVATFYLYTTYVHNFIFSLSTIIPMGSEDVLRKGSGTLCEALLMVEAHRCNIICPNKQVDELETFYNGHLLESETYIGGHVECLEAGVFRSDIATDFKLIPSALQSLIDRVDRDMTFALEVEHGLQRSDALNYDAVKQDIVQALEMLRDSPIRSEPPKIYHLDVGAMYPNIILTNRLQPSAIVSDSECASCEFNLEENACKRRMVWSWRGDFSPASMAEYRSVQRQLAYEKPASGVAFSDLSEKEQARQARARLKAYAQKAYQKTKVTVTEERVDTVCMRENSFYVDTVRAFRDRRYDYKLLTKTWKNKKVEAERKGDVVGKKNAEDKEVLMDSLQLAHKCILNSFYGYVMRKGARWRSMQMAGIVTHTGAQLIMQARELVEQVGRPLELDTDGIWCILPSSFPQDFKFVMRDGSKVGLQYPCAMLNADVAERYTNHQYQDLIAGTKRYAVRSECSIFFELDGPYKAMVLPASPEEGKLLKKKYAVFNFDGSLAELKGFELKRRGELELVKIFQSQVFEHFLEGSTLQECYDAVGAVGNQWLDVLDSEGANMDDAELLELISERKTISKTVDDYEGRKATSLTTAFRLADFLGAEMVKDKGLNCNLIISKYPTGAPVTDRAIPVAIFSADEAVRKHYLRKWLKDPKLVCEDFREVVDWEYYKDRLGKSIQKIVSIPAGLQKIPNPCPRIDHPVWLHRRLEDAKSVFKQQSISHMFQKLAAKTPNASLVVYKQQKSPPKSNDIEDIGTTANPQALVVAKSVEVNKTDLTGSFSMYHDPPATSDKFQKWLDDRKVEWAEGRRQKRISRSSDGSGGPILKRGAGIGDMIRNAAITAEKAIWQILEIQETDSPGLFLVWAMVGKNQLQRYYVEIPRVLYVNCAGDDASRMAVSIGGKPVKKDLPHGKPCLNLYEISISEQKFVRNDKVLGLFLCDPQIEGVYGSKLPLLFRGILRLGCMTRLLRSDRGTGSASKPIRLADLQMAIKTPHMYLEASSAVFRKIFIYISPDNLRPDAQGIVGIFIMDALNDIDVGAEGPTKHNARAFVFIAQAASMGAKPPMNSIYSKLCPGQQSGCKFSTAIVPSMYDALSKCNERLSQYLQERRGPTLVVVQAPMTARQCRKSMSLLTEFPLVMMPVNTKDGDFPALLWQNRIARIMIQRFLFFPSWFHDRVKSARFAQIPIGNLGSDAVISIIDTLFARHFEHNRHVLWGSNESLPDLGGSELDDVNLWAEPIRIPQLSEAGVYRSICVELEIFGLAVASIMSPGSLEAFGSAGAQANERSNSTMDGGNVVASSVSSDVSCLRAFMLLKALVSKWIHNVGTLRDQYCDAVLVSLYRFLCGHNGNALMNDPALHRIVFDMMGRMFTKFVGELKKLGVSVVYTDFHKVIIHTQKRDIGAAAEYLNFIVSSITSKETFRFLQLNTKRVWRQLIWLSASNFAGIPIALGGDDELEAEDNASPIELSPNWEASGVAPPNQTSANSSPIVVPDNDAQESDGDYDDDFGRNVGTSSEYDFLDDFEPDVEPDRSSRQESSLNMTSSEQRKTNSQRSAPESSHQNDAADSARSNLVGQWAIADFLSPSARIFMMRIIDRFLNLYSAKWDQLSAEVADSADRVAETEAYMRTLVAEQLSVSLIGIVDELRDIERGSTAIFASSKEDVQSALDFIKVITRILSLDVAVSNEVSALRRTLLTQVGVREFSSDSQFSDLSKSFILPDTVCTYCNACRDIDILRPESVASAATAVVTNPNRSTLVCPNCRNEYDRVVIESRLLDELDQIASKFVLQDLRCSKTRQVSTQLCALFSPASGALLPDLPAAAVADRAGTLKEIARMYRFEVLDEYVSRFI